jgi:pimeloyl-ACP methyl ester carboxylesterase
MGDSSAIWSLIQPELSRTMRVCSHDRAGTAWSDLGPIPRSMKQEVAELRALLEKAKESGPFVLVGHSYGGLLMRLYAATHPSDVAGIVLVDSTHESTVLSIQRRGEPQARWVRIREQSKGRSVPPAMPIENEAALAQDDRKREAFRACISKPPGGLGASLDRLPSQARIVESCWHAHRRFHPQTEDYWPDELQTMFEDRARNPQPLGARPLSVLTVGKHEEGFPRMSSQRRTSRRRTWPACLRTAALCCWERPPDPRRRPDCRSA